jgi:hypothetical protein
MAITDERGEQRREVQRGLGNSGIASRINP